jgi:hypothetical protein
MSADGFVSQVPVGPAPTPVVDGTRATLDAAREKAIARFAAPQVATLPPETPVATPKIEMDPATLKQLTKQAAALRRAESRVVELEAGSKDVGSFAAAKKLYGEGKRLEAIALLSGNDPSAEMEALMGAYLDSKPTEPVDPASAKLAELEAWKTEQTNAQEAARLAAEADKIKARDASIQGFAWSVLDAEKLPDGSPKFELCSLPKNRGEAAVAALRLVSQVYAPKEYPDGNVTPDQAKALFSKAFVDVQKAYEDKHLEEYGTPYVRPGLPNPRLVAGQPAPRAQTATIATTPAEPTGANQSPTLSRPAISTTSYAKSLTPAQALVKAMEKVRSFQR